MIDRIKVRAGPMLARRGQRAKAKNILGIFVTGPTGGHTVPHFANHGK